MFEYNFFPAYNRILHLRLCKRKEPIHLKFQGKIKPKIVTDVPFPVRGRKFSSGQCYVCEGRKWSIHGNFDRYTTVKYTTHQDLSIWKLSLHFVCVFRFVFFFSFDFWSNISCFRLHHFDSSIQFLYMLNISCRVELWVQRFTKDFFFGFIFVTSVRHM